jgi:hypothetical protein
MMFTTVLDYKTMTKLKFSDGEEFDLSGYLRKEHLADGWYLLWDNKLIPVEDEQKADEYINKHSQPSSQNDLHRFQSPIFQAIYSFLRTFPSY